MEEKREIVDNFFDLRRFTEVERDESAAKAEVIDSFLGGTSIVYAHEIVDIHAQGKSLIVSIS